MTKEVLEYSCKKEEMYEEVALQLTGLFEDCPHVIANLSNASAVLNQAMKDVTKEREDTLNKITNGVDVSSFF